MTAFTPSATWLQLSDFDSIMNAIMDFGLENPVIFNCQVVGVTWWFNVTLMSCWL
jgi:hypothetical protein